jgi:transcriptional regulator with XRE-family HTH domain
MPKSPASAVFATRLKARRTELGLSQAQLGIRMGLPEEVASTRINRYEKGVHAPNLDTMDAMARELGVPLAALLTPDDRLAQAICGFSELSVESQDRILTAIEKARKKAQPAARAEATAARLQKRTPKATAKTKRR